MKPVIEVHEAGFSIRSKTLVGQCSLALKPGRVTVIIGPNGAGKSTLLKLMSGELKPTAGVVESLGEPVARIPVWRLACRRAVMAQAARLNFPFVVHEVVRLGIEGVGRSYPQAEQDMLVKTALEQADVLALAARDYQSLSGGEQQRVQFARVLCQLQAGRSVEPLQALLLDEPIASLDLCHQLGLMNAAKALAQGQQVAVLAVLHDLNLAAHYADELIAMDRGRIVARGAPAEVLTPELLLEVFGVENHVESALRSQLGPFVLPQFCTIALQDQPLK